MFSLAVANSIAAFCSSTREKRLFFEAGFVSGLLHSTCCEDRWQAGIIPVAIYFFSSSELENCDVGLYNGPQKLDRSLCVFSCFGDGVYPDMSLTMKISPEGGNSAVAWVSRRRNPGLRRIPPHALPNGRASGEVLISDISFELFIRMGSRKQIKEAECHLPS